MDEPWIMTVKGPHGIKGSVVPMLPLDEQPASLTLTHTNHRSSNHSQAGKPHANGASRSPPKESTLNHYRSESRDSLRDGQAKHTPVREGLYMATIHWQRVTVSPSFLVLLYSPDRTRQRRRHRWSTRGRSETSVITATPAESPPSESRRRCATFARGTERRSASGNAIEKSGIGTGPAGRRGETANRTCRSFQWPITDPPLKTSRDPGARRSSSIRASASRYPALCCLSSLRYLTSLKREVTKRERKMSIQIRKLRRYYYENSRETDVSILICCRRSFNESTSTRRETITARGAAVARTAAL